MEPIVLILFHILCARDADTLVMTDPKTVDDKSVVPIYHGPDEITVSEPRGKAPRTVDKVNNCGKGGGNDQRGRQFFDTDLFDPAI